jgi:hypothetical protein
MLSSKLEHLPFIQGLINYTDIKAFVGFSLKLPAEKFSGINFPS